MRNPNGVGLRDRRARMARYIIAGALLVATVTVGFRFIEAKRRSENPDDDWFITEAWPLAESYADANGLTISKDNAVVFRYTDGVSVDVAFKEDAGSRSVKVSFSFREGRWAVLPANAVNLLDPERWWSH
jgi:hypothetical protein